MLGSAEMASLSGKMSPRELNDRVAVVTGAAGGIGQATAKRLADKGCHLGLVDVDEAGLERTRAMVARPTRKCSTHLADVSDKARMQGLPDEVLAEHGRVQILINNAGITLGAMFDDNSIEELERLVGVNLWGVVYGCKFFLPHLKQLDWAHIVNISSMFGLYGMPGQAGYSMTKAAVKGLSEALWTELANTGVSVTSVHPGVVRTGLIHNAGIEDPEERNKAIEMADKYGSDPAKAARRIVRAIERNQPRVLIGPDAHASALLKRAFPLGLHRMMTYAFRKSDVSGMRE